MRKYITKNVATYGELRTNTTSCICQPWLRMSQCFLDAAVSCVHFLCEDVWVIPVQLVAEENGMLGCYGDVWVVVLYACFVLHYAGGQTSASMNGSWS